MMTGFFPCALRGPEIDFIGMDMKEKKMTVIGSVNPLKVLIKLRKFWPTDIVSMGPVKAEEAKKEETKEPRQPTRAAFVWRWRRLGHGRRSPEQLEARADAGGEDGDPGEDGRAEQDQADGYHPQLLVGLVEGESPPRQQPAAADADEQKAAVGGQSHSEPGGHSARAGVAALEGFSLLHRLVCRHRFGLTRGGGRHGTEQITPGDLCGWRGGEGRGGGGSEGWRVERQRQATLPTMVFGGVINTMVFAWEYYMDVYILIC
ncbi:hypothetical protein BHE74_00049341 [Ensete ventricosum]|nr:hypothetical protein BHE74_00049341 [Ensete ventricosum]